MNRTLRQPRVLAFLFGSLALGSLLVVSIVFSLAPSKAMARDVTPITVAELQSLLLRAGLDPEALTAAGISPENAGAATLAAAEEAVASIVSIRAADAAFADADTEHSRLLELVRTRRANQQDVEAFTSAATVLATATTNRDAGIEAIRETAFEQLSGGQEILVAIAANRSKGGTLAMAVINRDDSQWLAVRNALANERISDENDVEPDGALQTLLEDVRDDNAVLAAQAALNTNLANVTTACNQAIDEALPPQ